jgi:hypothetical protein
MRMPQRDFSGPENGQPQRGGKQTGSTKPVAKDRSLPIPAVEGDVALAFLVLAEGPYISLFSRSASTLSPG